MKKVSFYSAGKFIDSLSGESNIFGHFVVDWSEQFYPFLSWRKKERWIWNSPSPERMGEQSKPIGASPHFWNVATSMRADVGNRTKAVPLNTSTRHLAILSVKSERWYLKTRRALLINMARISCFYFRWWNGLRPGWRHGTVWRSPMRCPGQRDEFHRNVGLGGLNEDRFQLFIRRIGHRR